MNYFKINLSRSMDAFTEHNIVTCATTSHPGFTNVLNIKKGDLVLIMDGIEKINRITIAKEDAYLGQVSYYLNEPVITVDPRATLELKPLSTPLNIPIDVVAGFIDDSNVHSRDFCTPLQVKMEDGLLLSLNKIISNSKSIPDYNQVVEQQMQEIRSN